MSNRNNLQRHERSDKAKWIATGIVIVLIFALIGGIIAALVTETNPKDWFHGETEQENPPIEGEEQTASNGGAVIGESVGNGVSLMSAKIAMADYAANGISPMADTAYTLAATIKPETAENKTVNWSIAWSNANSEWAKGKTVTDYVTLSEETSESGENITVTCLKDFGESIQITAVSAGDETIKVVCPVGYIKKVKGVNYTFKYDNSSVGSVSADSDGVYRFDYKGEAKSYVFTPVPVYSAYTIDTTYTSTITGKYTDTFGYGNGVSLDTSSLSAGLSDVLLESDPSEEAEEYIRLVTTLSTISGPNGFLGVLYTCNDRYEALSFADKEHSKVKNAYEAHQILKTACSSSVDISKLYEAQEVLSSYTPPDTKGGFMGGVKIPSVDALLQAAKACNTAQKGIVEYTVTFVSDDLSYSSKISLGYTASSLNVVRSIEVSLPSMVF